jgi:GT2 family glycosyltransferase
MTDVRVGIVSWNTARLLDRCLAALPAALPGMSYEVVVVDNASDDDSVDVARAHGATVVANDTNTGYARAMNRALAGSAAPVLIALNPDTVAPAGSLAGLVAALDDHPDAGVVVPRLVNSDGTLQHSVYRFPSLTVAAAVSALPVRAHRGRVGRALWLEGGAPHDLEEPVDWAIGAVHVIRASALHGEPPYRERWFMYVEDLDLCWRLRRGGWRTWLVPGVEILHVGNASGALAWGEARTGRWLDATYDWYALVHGRASARVWGALQVAGLAAKAPFAGLAALASPSGSGDAQRAWFRALRGWLRLHTARVRRLPDASAAQPPSYSSSSIGAIERVQS